MNPTPSPRCVILAIDPGKSGGWCLRGPASYASGTARNAGTRAFIVSVAVATAAKLDVPLVPVIEMWTKGGGRGRDGKGTRWTPSTMIGIGSQRGRWLEALELAGIPLSRVVSVTPDRWRKVLSGLPRKTTAQAKASAILVARGILGRTDVGPDEAEATCIAKWAETSPEVATIANRKTRARKAAA